MTAKQSQTETQFNLIRTGQRLVPVFAFILILLAGVTGRSVAQQGDSGSPVMVLSLEQALEMADEQNLNLKIAHQDLRAAQSQFRTTNALFLPSVTFEERAVRSDDPLSVFGFKLKQESVTTADFNPAILNDPDQTENYTTSFQVNQPLINPGKFLGRQALKKKVDATRQQQVRTRNQIRFQVEKTYYQLVLSSRRIGIIDTALTAARANRDQAQDLFDQGIINRSDLLASEVRVKQLINKRLDADRDREATGQQLAYLLGIERQVEIRPSDSLTLPQVTDPQVDYRQVNQTRSDMKALQYRVDASRKNLTAEKSGFVPSINLFGRYEWNDRELFGMEASNYMIGAALKWELFSGFQKIGAIQQSKAEYQKAKLEYRDRQLKNRVEINSVRKALQSAQSKVELTRSMVEQARESYRIRNNRYRQGLERISDMLMAESSLAESRLQYASALFNYRVEALKLELLLEQKIIN